MNSTAKNSTGLFSELFNNSQPKIALAGNPNVGKSTLFNLLTGSKQHTGNWPGKTVSMAAGNCHYNKKDYVFVDLPGTYSLLTHSAEEEVAKDYICFEKPDAVIVVCDATALERNLNLALQCLEICPKTLICINLIDEAEKKGIKINLKALSKKLDSPVVAISARHKKGIDKLFSELENLLKQEKTSFFNIKYNSLLEHGANMILPDLSKALSKDINPKWAAIKILENDKNIIKNLSKNSKFPLYNPKNLEDAIKFLENNSVSQKNIADITAKSIILNAEETANLSVEFTNPKYAENDRRIDRILTGKLTGIPLMLLMLMFVFWITIYAANIPSVVLSQSFSKIESLLFNIFCFFDVPKSITNLVVFGIFRVLSWVVSVMLPPMAIFFPLFTFLEDLGYLPRISFNLDGIFKKCGACGKQALTMCMGFGCNAAGVVGCRIIDSKRERLVAILTNSFVPCNGRFPMLISIITAFFTFNLISPINSAAGAIILTVFICIGIFLTFFISLLLTKTLFKGTPASFTLELPPYRKPQLFRIIKSSVFERTRFVLLRAVAVAAPAGAVIWLLANINVGAKPLLSEISGFLDPFASLLGLDGTILLAFILGLPANEIVIPLAIMIYTSSSTLTDVTSIETLRQLLLTNGWNYITAINMLLFSIAHWPCSTTLITIKKETQSIKYTSLAFIIPTLVGFIMCFFVNVILTLAANI